MDTGEGKFETFGDNSKTMADLLQEYENLAEKYPDHGGTFKVGEEIEIRGSKFRIQSIKPTQIRLKLLKKNKNPQRKDGENQ
jgi:uncharacterized Zn finger protein